MIRAWFAVGMIVSWVSVIAAQEANPPVAPKPAPANMPRRPPSPDAANVVPVMEGDADYMIEMRVLEGKGLFSDDATGRHGAAGDSTVELLRKWRQPGEKATAAGAAPHPVLPPAKLSVGGLKTSNATPTPVPPAAVPVLTNPTVSQPFIAAYYSWETAKNPGDDDLWDGAATDFPGITTVAAPRLITFARQSVAFEMRAHQSIVYLEPLGDSKYQAKAGPPQALGMKVTVAVQPIDGDDTCVELSPLEIEITALDGREPVEGLELLGLDVGKPIISTRSLRTTAKMKLGATRLIAIPSGPKTQAALLLRVKRAGVQFIEFPPQTDQPAAFSVDFPQDNLVGIGAALGTQGDEIIIGQIFPDTPAALSKALKVGDRILAVAQQNGAPVSITGFKIEDAVALIRGPLGTMVRLTVLSPGENESQARVVNLVRGQLLDKK